MSYIFDLRKIVGHRPLIMPCSGVIIEDGRGKVLLQLRADDGKWGFHGGALEIDEAAEDAARREVKEETGLIPDELRLLGVYSGPQCHHVYPNGDEVSCVTVVYVCGKYHGEMRLQPEEVEAVGWFGRDELPEDMIGNFRTPLLDYFAQREKEGNSRGL